MGVRLPERDGGSFRVLGVLADILAGLDFASRSFLLK